MSKNATKKRGGKLKWILIVIIVLGIIGAIFGGDDDKPDSSIASSDNISTEETENNSESKDDFLSDAEIIENDVLNGTGDTVLGKSGYIEASGYDISYGETADFERLCDKIDTLKDKYMWFTIDFCDGTGIVFTGCDILMPIYGELDETKALTKTIGFLTKNDNGYIYEEQSSDTPDSSDSDSSLTMGQKNALSKAGDYLSISGFSYEGLIKQLEFEGFSTEEATYAADNCGADWNEQAAKKAQEYLDVTSFSRSGLIDQLKFEGFTDEQAEYGVTTVGY